MGALELFVASHPLWAYLILFGGMFIEGEAFLIVAIIFAFQGYLSWLGILASAFVGVILGDITWYWLGRYSRNTKLGLFFAIRFSTYQQWLEQNFMSRYPRMAFYSKFLYYVNRLTPLIAGWNGFDIKKFIKIHLGAAVVWLSTMSLFGYGFGLVVGDRGVRWIIKRIEFVFIGSFLIFLLIEHLLKQNFFKRISKTLFPPENS